MKKKNHPIMKMNNLLIILITLVSFSLFSQEKEQYKAIIKNDNTKGFKFIELTPNIRAIANSNLSDLRILDKENKQIPYFLQEESFIVIEKFISFNKNKSFGYKNIHFNKKSTSYIVNNKTKKLLNNLTFKISNADVNKSCKIEGSDDNKKWFVVSEKIHLSLNNNSKKAFNYYNIQFPSIDYKYIKLVINDSLSAPINIKDIGYFNRKVIRKETTFNTLKYTYDISQEENSTIIHVKANRNFEINKIDFSIESPELYKRDVAFFTLKKRNKKEIKQIFKQFTLSSENKNTFSNLNIKHKEFWIEINNKDNQPLSINSINFYQKINYLVANLKANKEYSIIAGDKKLKKPSYDLVNFKDKIKTNLSTLKIEKEQFYSKPHSIIHKSFYEQTWFMWVSISFIALIILGFTMSLMRQSKEI